MAKTSVESWSMLGRISWKTRFFSSAVAFSSLVWMWREPSWSPLNSTMWPLISCGRERGRETTSQYEALTGRKAAEEEEGDGRTDSSQLLLRFDLKSSSSGLLRLRMSGPYPLP